jgi:hypothetical protein
MQTLNYLKLSDYMHSVYTFPQSLFFLNSSHQAAYQSKQIMLVARECWHFMLFAPLPFKTWITNWPSSVW